MKSLMTVSSTLKMLGIVLLLEAGAQAADLNCTRIKAQPDPWVKTEVNNLVIAARAAYEKDADTAYERTRDRIAATIRRCELNADSTFRSRYSEFLDFISTLAQESSPDHELGFSVPDRVYFTETRQYVGIPEFLTTPPFLRAVSRRQTLDQAKAMLRELNLHRAAADKLIFFSYQSRHLGTPDSPDSFWRLLILVPADTANNLPEKWVQFGIPDAGAHAPVRNVSVVAMVPGPEQTTNFYFKDYFRTFRRDGSITIRGRWELGENDDNCARCHKSGVLPIFPVAGTVSTEEQQFVELVNQRFRGYSQPRFGRYLDATKLGPGLGSPKWRAAGNGAGCADCHQPNRLGSLNWPMDRVLISSYVRGGKMPFGLRLTAPERASLYKKLIDDYFGVNDQAPGILKSWLLGEVRTGSDSDRAATIYSLPH